MIRRIDVSKLLFEMTSLPVNRLKKSQLNNTNRRPHFGAVILVAILLSGCAADRAYRSGKSLVEQDNVEAGLIKFQEANAREPGNAQFRQAYLQTKERAVNTYLSRGDAYTKAGKRVEAEQQFRRVLGLESNNDRAIAGLRNLQQDLVNSALSEEGSPTLAGDTNISASAKSPPKIVESELAASYKKPISIQFQDVALKQIFEVIAMTSGLNFLFDKDVKTDQKTSIFLKNSTIESAVHFMLLTNQLEQQILDANTILIYPNTPAKQKDYQEMVVKSFFLTNAEAKTVANTLKTILKSRDVVVDEKLNLLIVRDSPEAIKLAEKLVALQDVAEPEVMLEVEILEVKRSRLLELGIQWPDSLVLTPLPSAAGGNLTVRDLRTNLNGSTIGAAIGSVAVHARKEDGDANLLANPRIRVRNHEKAKILIGERLPNITSTVTSTGFVSESINYIDVGLKLEVEPNIFLDDDVAIKVGLEVSSLTNQIKTPSGSVAYQIGTRTANTVLRLKDGENQVLAGLINDEDRRSGSKIPGLGDLPLVGRLFGNATNDTQKTEIVLSITPRLIRNIQHPHATLTEFRSGTESSYRTRPESPITSLPNQKVNAPSLIPPARLALTPALPGSPSQIDPTSSSSVNAAIAPTANTTNGSENPGASAPAAGLATPAISAGAPPTLTKMQLQAPANVKAGETFEVHLAMQSAQPVANVPVTVGFDATVLEFVEATEGLFLKQGGAASSFTSKADPSGQVVLNAQRTDPGGATLLGDIAILRFKARVPSPASRIVIRSATPVSTSGAPIPVPLDAAATIQVAY
jgi:general secretion pathway protein D